MNLIGDPWIPVAFADGQSRPVGLRELYERAHEIRDLVLNPPQRISVMRLLLCITHAALDGPEDDGDWRACRKRIVPESLAYLDSRTDRFELFGERPFLQVALLKPTENATLDKLDFGLSSGNNDSLLDHAASPDGRTQAPARIALNLLTYQCFSPGGTIGTTEWAGKQTGRSSDHAPCIEGSALHAVLRGENLLTTLHLNLVPRIHISTGFGGAIWDVDLPGPDCAEAKTVSDSFLGRLVPLARGVRIHEGRTTCTLVNGLSFPKLPSGRELSATVVIRGKGDKERHAYLRTDLDKHPWREVPSVLAISEPGHFGGPRALRNLMRSPDTTIVDVWLGGMAADKGKVIDTAEWNFSVPVRLLDGLSLSGYAAGVQMADMGAVALGNAVKAYGTGLKAKAGSFRRHALNTYWSRLDQECHLLVEIVDRDSSMDPWHDLLYSSMHAAYAAACPHMTPRQIQAFAQGRRRLHIKTNDNAKKGNDA